MNKNLLIKPKLVILFQSQPSQVVHSRSTNDTNDSKSLDLCQFRHLNDSTSPRCHKALQI